MFGYVIANKEELSEGEFIRYRACYCGLCRELGKRYGQVKRITITYDMLFLILLLSSLYEPENDLGAERCIVHPIKKHAYLSNKFTDYAADMNIILAYYNCVDDWQDDKSIIGWCGSAFFKGNIAGIEERYPRQCAAIKSNLTALSALEKTGSSDIDTVLNHFGALMGELFVYRKDNWEKSLRSMASALGRFIYMLDAYEDLAKDVKKNRYNPLLDLRRSEDFERQCHSILTMLIGECTAEFEKLPLVQDIGILRNILYSGVWTRFVIAYKKNTGKEYAL